MILDKFFFSDKIPKVLSKGLDFQASRQLLVSSNISNMDTPGYKAADIDFSKQLREAMGEDNSAPMRTTNAKHIGPSDRTIAQMTPDVIEEPDAARSNGNNVVVDKEMAKLSETQIMYNTIAQMMSKKISMMRSAITESAQSV
jgi:flagellar basal-body rod protein FlgB